MRAEIEKKLTTSFEQELFAATLKNLGSIDNPLRLNNFAYAMRELVRHILKRLAPDESILQCPWYTNETDKENGITRKQRAYYAVQGGLSDAYIHDVLDIEVAHIHSKLIKAIDKLNKFTHIEPNTFNLPQTEVEEYANATIKSIYDFLILIDICRNEIIERLSQEIDSATVDKILKETIDALDVLASHHYIDEIYTEDIKIQIINHECIKFCVMGTLGCELQWGSNGDIRRGDGHVMRKSFSFECEFISFIEEPDSIEIIEDSLGIDTRTMY